MDAFFDTFLEDGGDVVVEDGLRRAFMLFHLVVVIFLAMTQHKEWKPLGLQAAAMQDFSIIDMEDDAHMIQARTEDIKASSIGITPRPSHLNRILAAPAA
uniref:Uncharacterized protein n=1 Tax=Lotharella globosa TaxID=91324 RepID=A0A7S3YZ86_9EUKA